MNNSLLSMICVFLYYIGRGGGCCSATRCHVCKNQHSQELCNKNIAECTNKSHDSCYTAVMMSVTYGKRYIKGCSNYENCKKLERLNNKRLCRETPSECIYCCRSSSNCNAYNSSPRSQFKLPAIVTVLSVVIYNAVVF